LRLPSKTTQCWHQKHSDSQEINVEASKNATVIRLRNIASDLDGLATRALHTRGHLVTVLRWLVPSLFVGIVGYHLYRIGLSHAWLAPPTSAAFYFVLLLPALLQPSADLIIYRYLWKAGSLPPISVLLRKRFMNALMLDYSGEAYFFLWARKSVPRPDNVIVHSIKDSNVLSAGAGLATTAIILVLLLAVRGLNIPGLAGFRSGPAILVAAIPAVLCLVLVVGGRKVTILSRLQMATVFLIHFARSAGGLLLEFALWWLSGALPSALVCLEFVALKVVVSRLPVVPNKGLLFAGVAITAASYMNVSTPRVTAVVIIVAAVEQLMSFAGVGIPWLVERSGLGERWRGARAEVVTASVGPPRTSPPVPPVAPAVYDPRPD
jgi:hypothetical protein